MKGIGRQQIYFGLAMAVLLSSLASSFSPPVLAANERPSWTKKRPSEGPRYKYYVGRASEVKTEKLGVEKATRDARTQAIQENYGVETSISKSVKETLSDTKYKKDYRETSAEVKVFGLEQVEIYSEEREKGKNIWVLFKYPKAEIEKEKIRQQKIALENKKKKRFTTMGGERGEKAGTLEVITNPEGARVYLDGEAMGRTHARLFLPADKYELVLEKEGFQDIKKEIIIAPKATTKIKEKMNRGYGRIRVVTEPLDGADVTINGVRAGLTPIEPFKVEAGIPIKVEISHAEAQYQTLITELEINEVKTKKVTLELKPAYLHISSLFPRDATLFLDGTPYLDVRKIKLNPRQTIDIRVSRDKYRPHEETLYLKGGQKKHLRIRLKRDDIVYMKEEKAPEKQLEKKRRKRIFGKSTFLQNYLSVGFSQGFRKEKKVGYLNADLSRYFVLPNGRINGIQLQYMDTGDKEEAVKKAGLFYSYHFGARESYSAKSRTPRLRPLTGSSLGLGVGFAKGISEIKEGKYKYQTHFLSLRLGYDLTYFFARAGLHIHRKLPEDTPFQLGNELIVSFGIRLAL